jgi:hypothetical protein
MVGPSALLSADELETRWLVTSHELSDEPTGILSMGCWK